MNHYLPIIDLTGALAGQEDASAKAASQIRAACLSHGFFYITGHGVPTSVIDAMFDGSRRVFALPDNLKQQFQVSRSPRRRGWEPMGLQALDEGKPADLLEGYNFGPDFDPSNQWPAEDLVPGFKQAAEQYFAALDALGRQLMRLIARGLELPPDYFDEFLQKPAHSQKLLHYPPQPAVSAPGQLGCGAHTDWQAITLLAQDDCGGLQVLGTDDVWHEAPPVPGSFVINLGDLMARWTNDRYRSTLHRVINRISGRDRYSIAYFFEVDFTTVIEALPGCVAPGEAPRHVPVTAGEHREEMFRRTRVGALA